MSSYQSVLARIVSRGKPVDSKRVDNNTYAEKRGDAVAIRLHQTDIVTYFPDGRCVLNTGGWKTVTTKARINDWAPQGVNIGSVKGQWRLYFGRGAWDKSVPFVDGIELQLNGEVAPYYVPVEGTYPSATREEELAVARKKLHKDIKAFTAQLPAKVEQWRKALHEDGQINLAGDCFYCQGIVTTPAGDVVTDNGHLWSHLREGYLFPTLVLVALADKGYRDPRFIFQNHVAYAGSKVLEQSLTKYLRKRLEPGQEPAADLSLREWYVSQAVEVLEKPSDFGYFGGDETLWNTSAPTWTKHRDSTNEEVANFEVVWEALKAEFPELVPADIDDEGFVGRSFTPDGVGALYVFGAGHWAVGHIDQIVVPVKLDPDRPVDVDNLHPAFIRVCEFGRAVRDYPVLDGTEGIIARLEDEQQLSEVRQYLDDPTDEQVRILRDVLKEGDGEYPEYLEAEQWLRTIEDIDSKYGLKPASWLDRYRADITGES